MTEEDYQDQAALTAMQGYIIYLGNNGFARDLSWVAKKSEELASEMVKERGNRALPFDLKKSDLSNHLKEFE